MGAEVLYKVAQQLHRACVHPSISSVVSAIYNPRHNVNALLPGVIQDSLQHQLVATALHLLHTDTIRLLTDVLSLQQADSSVQNLRTRKTDCRDGKRQPGMEMS